MHLVRYYAAELISAIEFMHSKGIIHRDLKPENVLITDDWHLKLVNIVGNSLFLDWLWGCLQNGRWERIY